ncbi:MAG: Carbon monoxide dehydrogenase small chain [Firmicutes bacterium]|nr:Carbon monoxide dehydrogenase small chain [Bacillota bacterium]
MQRKIAFTVNQQQVEMVVDPFERLVDVLRERLDLTGTKEGCGGGECGACTVLLDGESVNSCLVLAVEIDGKAVRTVEGLSHYLELDELQQAFVNEGAIQCGFCTPGMLMSARALLDKNNEPTVAEIREAISGNLCRCTGYERIVVAVSKAARPASALT